MWDRVSELRRLIESEMPDYLVEAWVARAEELKAQHEKEEDELRKKLEGHRDIDLELRDLALMKHLPEWRRLEMSAMGVNLGGLVDDYDAMIRSLTPEGERQLPIAIVWRRLPEKKKAEFKEQILSQGRIDEETLEQFIGEYWE